MRTSAAPLGSACVSFSCTWVMQREDGSTIRRWSQTYVFEETGGSWKIISATFHMA